MCAKFQSWVAEAKKRARINLHKIKPVGLTIKFYAVQKLTHLRHLYCRFPIISMS